MTNFLNHKTDFENPKVVSVLDELSFWSSRFGQLLFEHIEIRRDIRILDVGCGIGFPFFELAHVYGVSCRVTGIDIWAEALERARLKQEIYDLPNVAIVEADAAQQPFGDGEFDLIVSNLGVNNWAQPQAVLAECFRVAADGATLVLTTNLKGHYRQFYDVFRETLARMGGASPEYMERLRVQEEHRGTKESTRRLVEEAGFAVGRIVEDSFEMRFQDGSALLNHSLTKVGFLDGWKGVVDASVERGVFESVEKSLNEIAARDGELRMSVPMLYMEAKKPSRVGL